MTKNQGRKESGRQKLKNGWLDLRVIDSSAWSAGCRSGQRQRPHLLPRSCRTMRTKLTAVTLDFYRISLTPLDTDVHAMYILGTVGTGLARSGKTYLRAYAQHVQSVSHVVCLSNNLDDTSSSSSSRSRKRIPAPHLQPGRQV